MDLIERNNIFRQALADYRMGRLEDACRDLKRLIDDGSTDPKHVSYCGLMLATTEGRLREGLALCERALTLDFFNPELHVNLSQVHLQSGERDRAIQALVRGIRVVPRDQRLKLELRRLKPRSAPVFHFLRRGHPLNKYLGLARARLGALLEER